MQYTIYSILVNTLFLDLQRKTFNKFLYAETPDAENRNTVNLIVINNGTTIESARQIENYCKEKCIECYRPSHDRFHQGGISHQESLTWTFHNLIKGDKKTNCSMLVDFDLFPITYPNIGKTLDDYDLQGLNQGHSPINYLWPGLVIMNDASLSYKKVDTLDFRGAMIKVETGEYCICDFERGFTWDEYHRRIHMGFRPLDSGAMLYYLIKNYNLRIKEYSLDFDLKGKVPQSIEHLYDADFKYWLIGNTWLHFGRGSNWDSSEEGYFTRKLTFLNYWIDEVLK